MLEKDRIRRHREQCRHHGSADPRPPQAGGQAVEDRRIERVSLIPFVEEAHRVGASERDDALAGQPRARERLSDNE